MALNSRGSIVPKNGISLGGIGNLDSHHRSLHSAQRGYQMLFANVSFDNLVLHMTSEDSE